MTFYLVRGVTSGDMLTVIDPKDKDAWEPVKKVIGVSQIKTPKVGRMTPNEGAFPDEEWAWESRDFVRRRLIGKMIKFEKEAFVDTLNRDVGIVYYKDEEGKQKNLGVSLVEAGLASSNIRGKATDYGKLLAQAEIDAITNHVGIHSNDTEDHCRSKCKWEVSESDLKELAKLKGQKLTAIVENVFAGHAMRVCILPAYIYVPIQLTGIVCDKKVVETGDKTDKALWEQCHVMAKGLTDKFLTHKEVTLLVEGIMFENLLCTVMSGEKVFQEELLNRGLAKVFDMTLSTATHRERLRAAEIKAKEAKLGRWKNYVPPQVVTSGKGAKADEGPAKPAMMADFKGIVLQCVSADTFVLLNEATGEEHRLGLASVRGGGSSNQDAPRPKAAEGEGEVRVASSQASTFAKMERNEKDGVILFKNYYLEGRDFVRERVLGKQVDVKVDYMSQVPMQGQAGAEEPKTEVRPSVTIYYDSNHNIGEEVIKAGLAVPIYSKDGQSRDYFKYADAFVDAKEARRGLHGSKPGEHKVQDMARPDEKRGKAMLGYLQRAGSGAAGVPKLKATVEMVLSPSRVRLLIERENAIISLNLAGIATPQMPGRPGMPDAGDEPDPLAQEALIFTKRNLLQRDVEVQVEYFGMGTFVGNVYFKGKSFAVDLLEAGYATMLGQNTQSMSCRNDADSAEEAAKKAGKGIHSAGFPKKVAKALEKAQVRAAGRLTFMVGDQKQVPATITEVVNSTVFYFHTSENTEKMKKVDQLIAAKNPADLPAPDAKELSNGLMVFARFSQDKKWYRAKVTKVHDKKVDLLYIDFGNRETLPVSEIRKSSSASEMVTSIPAQANEAHLAFMHKLEPHDVGSQDATACFMDFVENRAVTVAHEYTDGRQKYYTVRFGKRAAQEELIKNGLGLVAANVQDNAGLSKPVKYLTGLEQTAKRERTGMWAEIRGDPRSYDDDY